MVCFVRLLQLELHNIDSIVQLSDLKRPQRFTRDIRSARPEFETSPGRIAEKLVPNPARDVAEPGTTPDFGRLGLRLICSLAQTGPEHIRLMCLNSLEKLLLNGITELDHFVEIAESIAGVGNADVDDPPKLPSSARAMHSSSPAEEALLALRRLQIIKIITSILEMAAQLPTTVLWQYLKLAHEQLSVDVDTAESTLKALFYLVFASSSHRSPAAVFPRGRHLGSVDLAHSLSSQEVSRINAESWEALRMRFLVYAADMLVPGSLRTLMIMPSRPTSVITTKRRSLTEQELVKKENIQMLNAVAGEKHEITSASTELGLLLLYESITIGTAAFRESKKLSDLLDSYVIRRVASCDLECASFTTITSFMRFIIPLLTDMCKPVHYQIFVNTFMIRNTLAAKPLANASKGRTRMSDVSDQISRMEKQEIVCRALTQILTSSGTRGVIDLFENFDCNPQRTPLLRRLARVCIKNAEPIHTAVPMRQPVSEGEPHTEDTERDSAALAAVPVKVWRSIAIQQNCRAVNGRYRASYSRVCALQKASIDVLYRLSQSLSDTLNHWEGEACDTERPECKAASDGWIERQRQERRVEAFAHVSPAKVSAFFVKEDICDSETDYAAAAAFLLTTPGLDLAKVGDILGSKGEWHQNVLAHFLELFDFRGLSVVNSLRLFFGAFKLPGEGQMIDRILDRFGKAFFLDQDVAAGQAITPPSSDPLEPVLTEDERTPRVITNESGGGKTIFKTSDVVFLLSYAIVMLNTDLHHPDTKVKMSIENFLGNAYRINDLQTLNALYLRSIYHSIREQGLSLSAHAQVSSTGLYPTEVESIDALTLTSSLEETFTHEVWNSQDKTMAKVAADELWWSGNLWKTLVNVMSNCMDPVYYETCLAILNHWIRIWIVFGESKELLTILSDMEAMLQPVFSYKTQALLPSLVVAFRQVAPLLASEPEFVSLAIELNDFLNIVGIHPRLSMTNFQHQFSRTQIWAVRSMSGLTSSLGGPSPETQPTHIADLRRFEAWEKASTFGSKAGSTWLSDLAGMFFSNSKQDLVSDDGVVIGSSSSMQHNVIQSPQMCLSSDGGMEARPGDSVKAYIAAVKTLWSQVAESELVRLPIEVEPTGCCLAADFLAWIEKSLCLICGPNLLVYIFSGVTGAVPSVVDNTLMAAITTNSFKLSNRSSSIGYQHRFNARRDWLPILSWVRDFDGVEDTVMCKPSLMVDTMDWFARRNEIDLCKRLLDQCLSYLLTKVAFHPQIVQTFGLNHALPNLSTAVSQPEVVDSEVQPTDRLQLEKVADLFDPTVLPNLTQVISRMLLSQHEQTVSSAFAAETEGNDDLRISSIRLLLAVTSVEENHCVLSAFFGLEGLLQLSRACDKFPTTLSDLGIPRSGPVPALPLILMTIIHRLSPVYVDRAVLTMPIESVAVIFDCVGRCGLLLLNALVNESYARLFLNLCRSGAEFDPPNDVERCNFPSTSWPSTCLRYLVQCYLFVVWQMLPSFCITLPDPNLSLFEPEEISGTDEDDSGAWPSGEIDDMSQFVKRIYDTLEKWQLEERYLGEVWRVIGQLLCCMISFGTRRERRSAMLLMSAHLTRLPNPSLSNWFEIIEFHLLPQLSLNYSDVYPCPTYPLPLKREYHGEALEIDLKRALGKSLIQFLCRERKYESVSLPFSKFVVKELFPKAKAFLGNRAILLSRNNQVFGDLKRHILNVLHILNDPIVSVYQSDLLPPAPPPMDPTASTASPLGEGPVHGLLPVVCRLLRVCLHEVAVHDRVGVNSEAILETLKTLIVVVGSAPELISADDQECAVILQSLQRIPDAEVCPQLRRSVSKPAHDIQRLDPRIRATFECIKHVVDISGLHEVFEGVYNILAQ